MKNHSPRLAAYTLPELLVCVGILGVLAGLVVSGVAQLRHRARRTVCANQLKQLGSATAMYEADHEDRHPPTFVLGANGLDQTNWFHYTSEYHGSDRILRCPVPPGQGPFDRRPPLSGRYAANFRLGGCQWPGTSWNVPPLAFSSVLNPSGTVHLTDSGTVPSPTSDPTQCVRPDSVRKTTAWILDDPMRKTPCEGCVTSDFDPNWGGPDPRHGLRSNNTFVDGHVQAQQSRDWYWAGSPWLDPMAVGR